MRNVFYLLLLVVMLAGCKSTKNITSSVPVAEPCYLSSKLQLTIPSGSDGSITTGGTMKMKGGERVQLSILMPILRTEIARLEITPDEVLLIDRMNKRYVRASGKAELSGKELGIPSLERAKVRLYDFSSKEFAMTPTEISDRYTQVPLEELLNMLTKL